MTKGNVQTTVESSEYNFIVINGLKDENEKLKDAIKELLNVIGNKHPLMSMPEDEKLYLAYHNAKKLL
jgi:hypothetical protein